MVNDLSTTSFSIKTHAQMIDNELFCQTPKRSGDWFKYKNFFFILLTLNSFDFFRG